MHLFANGANDNFKGVATIYGSGTASYRTSVLWATIGGVVWEAIQRLHTTPAVDGGIVAIVAAIGVVLNILAALLFAKGRAGDMNIRAAFLHLMADAAVSAGVVVAGVVVWKTGWSWIAPATSLIVSAVILVRTWKLLREALDLLLDAVPGHINTEDVQAFLAACRPGVGDVFTDARGQAVWADREEVQDRPRHPATGSGRTCRALRARRGGRRVIVGPALIEEADRPFDSTDQVGLAKQETT